MHIVKVIMHYSTRNFICCSVDMHMRVRFVDRLKFLIYGEFCLFRFEDENLTRDRKKDLAAFREWLEKYKGTQHADPIIDEIHTEHAYKKQEDKQ